MITRPTTDQILRECSRQLSDTVLPEVQSEHARVTVQMLEHVLRNAAIRCAHEIAWMRDETDAMESYARDVTAALPDRGTETARALAALDAAPRDSLQLEDVVDTYGRAGEALSCALEAAVAASHAELSGRATELLARRNEHELEINDNWVMIGR